MTSSLFSPCLWVQLLDLKLTTELVSNTPCGLSHLLKYDDHHVRLWPKSSYHSKTQNIWYIFNNQGNLRIVISSNGLLDPIIEVGDLCVNPRLSRPAQENIITDYDSLYTPPCSEEEFMKTCSKERTRQEGCKAEQMEHQAIIGLSRFESDVIRSRGAIITNRLQLFAMGNESTW